MASREEGIREHGRQILYGFAPCPTFHSREPKSHRGIRWPLPDAIVDVLCSSIGSLSNPSRIGNSLKSIKKIKIDEDTVSKYIRYLEEAYLFEGARRYDIKGHQYYNSIRKYYAGDIGLRNARLNFRQQELTHIMENIIYDELRLRDYLVDVGVRNRVTRNEAR